MPVLEPVRQLWLWVSESCLLQAANFLMLVHDPHVSQGTRANRTEHLAPQKRDQMIDLLSQAGSSIDSLFACDLCVRHKWPSSPL